MSDLAGMAKQAGLPWCDPDDCPPAICGGPHRDVVTHLGTERLRFDQEPIGRPVPSFADAMFPPDLLEAAQAHAAAGPCPAASPCGHPGLVHEYDHPVPRCQEDGCPCGLAAPPEGSQQS